MYKCRKVDCPYCHHTFMWMNGEPFQNKTFEYMLEGSDRMLDDAICPNCGRLCLLQTGVRTGLKEDDPRVKKYGIRGI